MKRDLGKLAALAVMLKETELARLAEASRKRRQIEADIARLRAEQSAVARNANLDMANQPGAGALWLTWSSRRLTTLNQAAVEQAARTETQLVSARRAFGQAQALQRLARKQNWNSGKPRRE